MIWALWGSMAVLGLTAALTALARSRIGRMSEESASADLRLALRGYRTDQVDEALAALRDQVRRNDVELAWRRGESIDALAAASDPGHDGTAASADEDDHARGEAADESAAAALAAPAAPAVSARRRRWLDVAALTAYAALGWWVLSALIASFPRGYLWLGVQDQQLFEWFYAVTAHNVTHLESPLFTDLQNFPAGVNLMANTPMLGLSVPLTPLTHLIGSPAVFVLVEWAGLSLTAFGWYWLFSRHLGVRQGPAFAGGLLVGFSPAMVSHANGHPNWLAQFLFPAIIAVLVRINAAPTTRTAVRWGLVLGAVVTWQLFVAEEPLLLGAIGMAIGALVLTVQGRVRLSRLATGVGTGAALSGLVTAYPLWWQFRGPQSYGEIWHPPAGNDLASLWAMASMSWGSDIETANRLAMNRTEENSFFGVGLWVVLLLAIVVLRRHRMLPALGAVVIISIWLSLGESVTWEGQASGIPSLWSLVDSAPLVENILPSRFTLVAIPAMAALLALALDAMIDRAQRGGYGTVGALVAVTVAALAFAQMVPTPLIVRDRPAQPEYFASGLWHDDLGDGAILLVPRPDISDLRGVEWQVANNLGFPLVGGYFVGPGGSPDDQGIYGAPATPVSTWLAEIGEQKQIIIPDETERESYLAELRASRVDAVVLPPRPEQDAYEVSISGLLGSGREVGGVIVWSVPSR